MPGPDAPVRYRLIYWGRVQGVFFRATAQELARKHAVAGFARNLNDGTVELEVQGMSRHVEALLKDLAAHFSGFISRVTKVQQPVQEGETRFEVRH